MKNRKILSLLVLSVLVTGCNYGGVSQASKKEFVDFYNKSLSNETNRLFVLGDSVSLIYTYALEDITNDASLSVTTSDFQAWEDRTWEDEDRDDPQALEYSYSIRNKDGIDIVSMSGSGSLIYTNTSAVDKEGDEEAGDEVFKYKHDTTVARFSEIITNADGEMNETRENKSETVYDDEEGTEVDYTRVTYTYSKSNRVNEFINSDGAKERSNRSERYVWTRKNSNAPTYTYTITESITQEKAEDYLVETLVTASLKTDNPEILEIKTVSNRSTWNSETGSWNDPVETTDTDTMNFEADDMNSTLTIYNLYSRFISSDGLFVAFQRLNDYYHESFVSFEDKLNTVNDVEILKKNGIYQYRFADDIVEHSFVQYSFTGAKKTSVNTDVLSEIVCFVKDGHKMSQIYKLSFVYNPLSKIS